MKVEKTKMTTKGQTTVPKHIRKFLGVDPGEEVEWHVVKGMVLVDKQHNMKNPVEFLTSQIKLNLDAVKLVKNAREES